MQELSIIDYLLWAREVRQYWLKINSSLFIIIKNNGYNIWLNGNNLFNKMHTIEAANFRHITFIKAVQLLQYLIS